MNCNEAAEFVSALCDGETVSSSAAEHIGGCSACRAHLQEYLAMAAELRRVASLESAALVKDRTWSKNRRTAPAWWTKGWESMRIPKFAFALLVIAIVALGSGLAVISARAHTVGSVLMLTVKGPHADNLRCALSLVDKKWGICAQLSPPQYLLSVEVLSHTEDQVELGIREQYNPAPVGAGSHTTGLEDLQKIPQKSYWFRPGQKLQIDVSGAGPLVLTGGLTDHIPPFPGLPEVEMDPKANELRVTSPLLLRGEKVVFDDEGASSIQKDRGVVQMYWPGQGLWVLSLHPLEGAVEGHVSLSRVKFAIDGQAYTFVMAAPVSRADHIWILHDPNYKPSDPNLNNGFLSAADPEHLANSSQVQSLGK